MHKWICFDAYWVLFVSFYFCCHCRCYCFCCWGLFGPQQKNEPHISISTCDIKTTFAIKATLKKRQIHEMWKKLSRHTSFGECLLSLGVELDPTW